MTITAHVALTWTAFPMNDIPHAAIWQPFSAREFEHWIACVGSGREAGWSLPSGERPADTPDTDDSPGVGS